MESPCIRAHTGQECPLPGSGSPLVKRECGARDGVGIRHDRLATARVVGLADGRDAERETGAVQKQIERPRLEQQIERLGLRPGGIVRYFDQRVTLQLSLRFESPIAPRLLCRDLQPLIAGLALRSARFARQRVGLEQLELAAVMHDPERKTAARR